MRSLTKRAKAGLLLACVTAALVVWISARPNETRTDFVDVDLKGEQGGCGAFLVYRASMDRRNVLSVSFDETVRELSEGDHEFDLGSSATFVSVKVREHRKPQVEVCCTDVIGEAPEYEWTAVQGRIKITKQTAVMPKWYDRLVNPSYVSVRLIDCVFQNQDGESKTVKAVSIVGVLIGRKAQLPKGGSDFASKGHF